MSKLKTLKDIENDFCNMKLINVKELEQGITELTLYNQITKCKGQEFFNLTEEDLE